MALIRHFNRHDRERYSTHQEIDANYFSFERDGKRLLQIDTTGRETRENPGKQSQTLQLDEVSAKELYSILRTEFGFN